MLRPIYVPVVRSGYVVRWTQIYIRLVILGWFPGSFTLRYTRFYGRTFTTG